MYTDTYIYNRNPTGNVCRVRQVQKTFLKGNDNGSTSWKTEQH